MVHQSGGSATARSARRNVSKDGRVVAPCSYCGCELHRRTHIVCAECTQPAVALCVDCFSVGAALVPHRDAHDYRVVTEVDVPVFAEDWTAAEELRLLDAIAAHGPHSWKEVAEIVENKSQGQCEMHYNRVYLDSAMSPLPDYNAVISRYQSPQHRALATNATEEGRRAIFSADHANDANSATPRASQATCEQFPPLVHEPRATRSSSSSSSGEKPNRRRRLRRIQPIQINSSSDDTSSSEQSNDHSQAQDVGSVSRKGSRRCRPPRRNRTRVEGTYSLTRRSARRIRIPASSSQDDSTGSEEEAKDSSCSDVCSDSNESSDSNSDASDTAGDKTLPGYYVKRGDFDVEWDESAEESIASLIISETDTQEEVDLKLRLLELYNVRLDERESVKRFVIAQNLVDIDSVCRDESLVSNEQREVSRWLKRFARPLPRKLFSELEHAYLAEDSLVREIALLSSYRAIGIRNVAQLAQYNHDAVNRMRDLGYELKANETLSFSGQVCEVPLQTRTLQRLAELTHGENDGRAETAPQAQVRPLPAAISYQGSDISSQKLSSVEQEVCAILRLSVEEYLDMRATLTSQAGAVFASNDGSCNENVVVIDLFMSPCIEKASSISVYGQNCSALSDHADASWPMRWTFSASSVKLRSLREAVLEGYSLAASDGRTWPVPRFIRSNALVRSCDERSTISGSLRCDRGEDVCCKSGGSDRRPSVKFLPDSRSPLGEHDTAENPSSEQSCGKVEGIGELAEVGSRLSERSIDLHRRGCLNLKLRLSMAAENSRPTVCAQVFPERSETRDCESIARSPAEMTSTGCDANSGDPRGSAEQQQAQVIHKFSGEGVSGCKKRVDEKADPAIQLVGVSNPKYLVDRGDTVTPLNASGICQPQATTKAPDANESAPAQTDQQSASGDGVTFEWDANDADTRGDDANDADTRGDARPQSSGKPEYSSDAECASRANNSQSIICEADGDCEQPDAHAKRRNPLTAEFPSDKSSLRDDDVVTPLNSLGTRKRKACMESLDRVESAPRPTNRRCRDRDKRKECAQDKSSHVNVSVASRRNLSRKPPSAAALLSPSGPGTSPFAMRAASVSESVSASKTSTGRPERSRIDRDGSPSISMRSLRSNDKRYSFKHDTQ